jgi:hypothetical protein
MSNYIYNNVPNESKPSSSDATLNVFNNYNSLPTQLNNSALIAMTGFLEKRGFKNPSAETVAITILTQAKKEGYDPMAVLQTLQGASDATLSTTVAQILNYNRFKTSTLGIANTNPVVDAISRNILV